MAIPLQDANELLGRKVETQEKPHFKSQITNEGRRFGPRKATFRKRKSQQLRRLKRPNFRRELGGACRMEYTEREIIIESCRTALVATSAVAEVEARDCLKATCRREPEKKQSEESLECRNSKSEPELVLGRETRAGESIQGKIQDLKRPGPVARE
ncbi:hypothetical protein B0H16DRAFT_1476113 [Mycena metata]|uniref:Uncharacterized protein n=1 Tax=Mycena metata TaxID=1033252 RepID=A0AAD7HC76_9AGAR|nr:hypothetical protein B0H16DRAFT_1476113 [Mycena metata]